MSKGIISVDRYRIDEPVPFASLEYTTGDRVWLTPSIVCERAGFLGVPLSHADVLVAADVATGAPLREGHVLCLEHATKAGRYSGQVRDRFAFRTIEARHAPTWAQLEITPRLVGPARERHTEVIILGSSGETLLERRYRTLEWGFDPADSGRVLLWQYNRYFRFLPEDDVLSLAQTFTLGRSPRTKSGANQLAAQALYRLARDLGYRKMTLRERIRAWGPVDGPDRPCWQLACTVPSGYRRTGCGEATLRAAAGGELAPEDFHVRYYADDN